MSKRNLSTKASTAELLSRRAARLSTASRTAFLLGASSAGSAMPTPARLSHVSNPMVGFLNAIKESAYARASSTLADKLWAQRGRGSASGVSVAVSCCQELACARLCSANCLSILEDVKHGGKSACTFEDVGVDVWGDPGLPHVLAQAAPGGQHLPAAQHAFVELHQAVSPLLGSTLFWRNLSHRLSFT
jgi:hypothetical protein